MNDSLFTLLGDLEVIILSNKMKKKDKERCRKELQELLDKSMKLEERKC